MNEKEDHYWMQQALEYAARAADAGEVPVGAVVVCNNELIAGAHNEPIKRHDPSAHAEMLAIRLAAEKLQNYRLNQCTLFVTLEPCPMCAGAILNSRIKRVVYGAKDPKAGASGSVVQLLRHPQLPHLCAVTSEVLAAESQALLTQFFNKARLKSS
jgi:tRNA(adenine34) deaminase